MRLDHASRAADAYFDASRLRRKFGFTPFLGAEGSCQLSTRQPELPSRGWHLRKKKMAGAIPSNLGDEVEGSDPLRQIIKLGTRHTNIGSRVEVARRRVRREAPPRRLPRCTRRRLFWRWRRRPAPLDALQMQIAQHRVYLAKVRVGLLVVRSRGSPRRERARRHCWRRRRRRGRLLLHRRDP